MGQAPSKASMTFTLHAHHIGSVGALARERARVHEHLTGAERLARQRRPRLEPLVASCRSLLLDELSRYRRLGRFPRNLMRGTRPSPQFIDEHGTRCAVAHLMEVSGQGEIVRRIARTQNAARVHALARLPELRAWLAAAGLSLDEAARIQPTYEPCHAVDDCVCRGPELAGVALGTVVEQRGESVVARIDRIEGQLAGATVGDQRPVVVAGLLEGEPVGAGQAAPEVGSQFFIGHTRYNAQDGVPTLQLVGPYLRVAGEAVGCNNTNREPISLHTVFEALLADSGRCVEVVARENNEWQREQCGSDVASESGDGCAVTIPGSSNLHNAELTSAALLVALVLHRRRRREPPAGPRT
jgi:MYXO-CTERM domain-containing protein